MKQLSIIPFLLAGTGLLAMLSAGCKQAEEDVYVPPPDNVMKGKPDPKLTGKYIAEGGDPKYAFDASGKFDFEGKAKTPNGVVDHKYSATWAVDGTDIYMTDQAGNVSRFAYKVDGNKLLLSTKGKRPRTTVLVKQ